MNEVKKLNQEMANVLESVDVGLTKFYGGNKSAAKDVRKGLRELRRTARDMGKAVLEAKRTMKSTRSKDVEKPAKKEKGKKRRKIKAKKS